MEFNDFLREEKNGSVTFTGYYMEVYIPTDSVGDEKVFVPFGDHYKMLGLVSFKAFKNENDKKGEMFTLTIPSLISTFPSDISKTKINLLDGEVDEEESYTILKYYNGDTFIDSLTIKQDANAAFQFINQVHSGKVPRAVAYNKILELYNNGATNIHGVGLGVPSATIEMIIAGICRDPQDINKPFRLKAGKNPNINMHDYVPINMKLLPMLSSTFAALSFERLGDAIVSSVTKTKLNKDDSISPIEKSIE